MSTVDGLADELLDALLDTYPMISTVIGISGPRDRRLTDFTEASEAASAARVLAIAERATALDPAELTADQRVTRAVILHQAHDMTTQLASRLTEFSISDTMSGAAAELLSMLPMIAIGDADQADAYLVRLATIPEVLSVLADRHRAGIAAGRLPVRHLVEAAANHLDRYLAGDDPLRKPGADGVAGADGAAFSGRRDQVIRDAVQPAFAVYRDILRSEIAPHGRGDDKPGLSWLPGGDEIYASLIRMHTSTDRSAEDLHTVGLDIITRLRDEYREVGGRVFGVASVSEVFERMRSDKSLRWRNGDELLDAARAAIARASAAAPDWFGQLPEQECEVRPVPADEAPGAPAAYYLLPALDGSRPGIYFANTYEAEKRDRFTCEAIAFHEAVPGHHFQSVIATQLTDLPLLRRLAPFTAYAEGWGLYAERLADEMGLYSDDVARLGMLANDSLRAARLVVDTGLHAKGWSRAQAVQYMREQTPAAPVEIESEVDRYIAAPGQALAYMVGRIEIQRIRAEAERVLGSRFDIRDFHDLVLGGGALPLAVLDEVVTAWVAARP